MRPSKHRLQGAVPRSLQANANPTHGFTIRDGTRQRRSHRENQENA